MGVPCLTTDTERVTALQQAIAADPTATVTVDLDAMTATVGDISIAVEMGAGPRQMFLKGTWDACGQLVARRDAIAQTADRLPYVGWAAS